MPRIRSSPEDFVVDEVPEYSREGEGAHTYLLIEKRLATTDQILRQLARAAGVQPRAVGYAGRKDKYAVTRQWFSVPDLDADKARGLELDRARVIEVDRDRSKLRTGMLRGNRFSLVVRDVTAPDARRAGDLLDSLVEKGLPNRYGPQRFGRDGRNVEKGTAILRAERVRIERRTALLLVSAVQSAVFNEVLERRPFGLDQVVPGDVAVDHRTGELFVVDDVERDGPRAAAFEISATGPIFGFKMKRPTGAVATLEQAAMAAFDLPDARRLSPPRGVKLYGTRRPLRARIEAASWRYAEGNLHLAFTLPAGTYATILIAELFPDGFDEGPKPPAGVIDR